MALGHRDKTWLMDGAVIAGGAVALLVTLALVALIPLWAIADVASRPRDAFPSSGMTKTQWLSLLIILTACIGPVGLGLALNHVLTERRRLPSGMGEGEKQDGRLAIGAVALTLVLFALVESVIFVGTRSTSTTNPVVAIEGSLRSGCSTAEKVSIALRGTSEARALQETTIGGKTNRDSFVFLVRPGTYTVIATSTSRTQRWSLTYGTSKSPVPVAVNPPVAMDVSVGAACA
jgi:hypothetical protein